MCIGFYDHNGDAVYAAWARASRIVDYYHICCDMTIVITNDDKMNGLEIVSFRVPDLNWILFALVSS